MWGNRLRSMSAILVVMVGTVASGWSQDYNLSPPAQPVNLLWIHHSTGANGSHKFDETGSRTWIDGRAVVDCDTWTHVAFTWTGSQARHFVDGVQIIETSGTTRAMTDNSNHLRLGGMSGNLKGGIREVAIYNRALTPAEVRRIYQANAVAPRAEARGWRKY